MKDWFKKHHRVFVAMFLFVVTYVVLYNISAQYINFDNSSRNRQRDYMSSYERTQNEYNVRIARFYYIQLPFGAAVPTLLYLLSAFLERKKLSKKEEEENQEAETQRTKNSVTVEDQTNILVKKERLLLYAALSKVPANIRDRQIESIIYGVYNNYDPLTITKESLPFMIVKEAGNVSNDKKSLYLLAASYAFLYCCKDVENAVKYGKEVLKETLCYSKFSIKDTYVWLIKEPNIVAQLFDEQGYSKLPYNPLGYKIQK